MTSRVQVSSVIELPAPLPASHTTEGQKAHHPPPPASLASVRLPLQQHRRRLSGGRSHHGGSSQKPSNEFPIFSITGDVEVVLRAPNQEKKYLLHSLILAQHSEFFEEGLRDGWSGARTQNESTDGRSTVEGSVVSRRDDDQGSRLSVSRKKRWRYELDWEGREGDEVPLLILKPPTASNAAFGGSRPHQPPPTRNKPPPPQQGFFRTMANLTGIQSAVHLPSTAAPEEPPLNPTLRDYDNLFRIFYNHPPNLNSVNIATAYLECKALLGLADIYEALPVVCPRVDHHMLRFSSKLYKHIAKYPHSFLRLGNAARSRVMFSEALIHVVGEWPKAWPDVGPSSYAPLPNRVIELIKEKVEDLQYQISKIEGKLFRLTLTTSRGERVSPSNAYLDWLAVSLFRQFLVENTTPPPAPILKNTPAQPARNTHSSGSNGSNGTTRQATTPNGPTGTSSRSAPPPFSIGRTYRLIGSSNPDAYLTRDDLKRFLKLHPSSDIYSRENLKKFERKIDEIKRLAREIVKPLMRNFLELELRTGNENDSHLLPYLTCTKVEEDDFNYVWD